MFIREVFWDSAYRKLSVGTGLQVKLPPNKVFKGQGFNMIAVASHD